MSNLPAEILYEDNHLLAVNKPAGLLTQPTDLQPDSLETLFKAWIKEHLQKPGNVFLGVVHRLDKPVSGIVLFAKTSKGLSRLNASMRSREMLKTYYALVEGKPSNAKDKLEHYVRHDEYHSEVCKKEAKDAKLAILHYETIKSYPRHTLLKINLETGRYHQIRVQCAAMGCPIVGDMKYGAKHSFPGNIIALHHHRMEFEHPVTHLNVTVEAALPAILTPPAP